MAAFKSRGSVRTVAYTMVGLSPLSRYMTRAESSVCGTNLGPIVNDNKQATAVMHASDAVFCRKLSFTIMLNEYLCVCVRVRVYDLQEGLFSSRKRSDYSSQVLLAKSPCPMCTGDDCYEMRRFCRICFAP